MASTLTLLHILLPVEDDFEGDGDGYGEAPEAVALGVTSLGKATDA